MLGSNASAQLYIKGPVGGAVGAAVGYVLCVRALWGRLLDMWAAGWMGLVRGAVRKSVRESVGSGHTSSRFFLKKL